MNLLVDKFDADVTLCLLVINLIVQFVDCVCSKVQQMPSTTLVCMILLSYCMVTVDDLMLTNVSSG